MLEFDAITSQEIPQDSSLNQLQGQIKNVMIPLLIKIFQLRLEVQQTNSPPSRLQNAKPKASLEELIEQLSQLNQDLKLLQNWNQSCQMQIEKVLQEANDRIPSSFSTSIKANYPVHPAVQKSFQGAMLAKKGNHFTLRPSSFWKRLYRKFVP
ncbi:MAG: hypothetical protein K2Y01_04880 [Rhabdochlamydiaceae bacterium]|nr:hypothetical protein [Rhabdochlamydiaceae bacterium]